MGKGKFKNIEVTPGMIKEVFGNSGEGKSLMMEEESRKDREREDMELGNTIKNLRTPEEDARLDAFFQTNFTGRLGAEMTPEVYDEWEKMKERQKSREEDVKTKFLSNYPKLQEMKERMEMQHSGDEVSPDSYEAELREYPPADPVVIASRRESALRQLAGEVSNDRLMNLYKEAIITRERMTGGQRFGLVSRVELDSRIQVYETELGNRLSRKEKGK